ncbi:MAG: hypothetical protein OK456_01465 [Thaumarchaeota archaeon]|nr:hypothetical protein [Nitrososphaerota archaeon]
MASLARRTAVVLRLELLLLAATWFAGIYVNGFVPIIPGESASEILLTTAVASHVVLALLSFGTSIAALSLASVAGPRRVLVLTLLATVSIAAAGASGLLFVLGGASDSNDSMVMATAFITALFLSFLALVSLRTDGTSNGTATPGWRVLASAPSTFCGIVLGLFYAVFVSGVYVNLFVAGPVFSLPLNSELLAFTRAESTAPFILHEGLGAALLLATVLLAIVTWSGGKRKLASLSMVVALLVAYSAYVGSTNLTSPPVPAVSGAALSVVVPMLSAAAFIAALILTMIVALLMRAEIQPR